MATEKTDPLIRSLLRPEAFPHSTSEIRFLETHISWVLLTGPFAYKIKKPVALGFLDFSNLESRKHFCDEELRLNRFWAPDIYLDVVEIRGSDDTAAVGGEGPLIDYAVKMIQFPQNARLDAQLAAGSLDVEDMQSLAAMLAARHGDADVKTPDIVESVREPMLDNFQAISPHHDQARLHFLKAWTLNELARRQAELDKRLKQGFIRECHGDLHLANLVRLRSGITAFDCVEFSETLRNIDVISDVAFLVMDLVARQRNDLAYEFLNRYLECSGDYEGMRLFDLHFVYHCLIRAKIAAIRGSERSNPLNAKADEVELRHYLEVAKVHVSRPPATVIAMHGLSGSGKTWLSDQLMRALPAIRVRSDIERKRIYGLGQKERSSSEIGQGIYTDAASDSVYDRLAALTATLINSGHSAIVDASFLKSIERQRIRDHADQLGVPFLMIDTYASATALAGRLRQRQDNDSDASEADINVLHHQLDSADSLTADEQSTVLAVDTERPLDLNSVLAQIRSRAVRS